MAHFFSPPEQTPVNFFHLSTSRKAVARLWNVGGPKLKIVSDDVSTATVLAPVEVQPGIVEFIIDGVKPGCSLIRANNDQDLQWALTQAVVHPAPKPMISSPNSPEYRDGNFDSCLYTELMNAQINAELLINLRICLKQVPPGPVKDSEGDEYTALAWPTAAWDQFRRVVQRDGQAFWDDKFWLRTPPDYAPLVTTEGNASFRCNVRCRLKLELVPEGYAHQVIQAAYLDPSKTGAQDYRSFRSNMSLYCQKDIQYRKVLNATALPNKELVIWIDWKRTVMHELGHSLGEPHIGEMIPERSPACKPGDPYLCYGVTMEDLKNIMGSGSKLAPINAKPWLDRIAQHTNTQPAAWQASLIPLLPVRLR
jgi:hypothetical protein